MSEPNDAKHSFAATDAALPPEEPPGTYFKFHGFFVGPYALNSVVNPIANSSKFVFPVIIASSFCSLFTTVAVYGATKFSKIFEAQVVFEPVMHMLSLIEIGNP